ncbi:MAG: hypothetical protein E7590_00360 [Ruminococcaceae bacterium]|nr:hypothetical protein [Oscillospiraceae bacterium]
MTEEIRARRSPVFWFDLLCPIALFLLSLPLIYRFALVDLDPHHTGLMYKTALDVANGKILFRETFTQYGALTVYLQSLAILVLGPQITSILFSSALFYAASFPLLYLTARHFLRWGSALAATLLTLAVAPFYFWQYHPWSSVYALFFLLLSLWLLQHAFAQKARKRYLFFALSGLCAALTFWCRQPVGFVTALAGLLCILFWLILLWKQKKRVLLFGLLSYTGGIGLGVLSFLLPIAASGATRDFTRQCLTNMASFAADRADEGTGAWGILQHVIYSLFRAPLFADIAEDVAQQPRFDLLWLILPLLALGMALWLPIRCILGLRCGKERLRPTESDVQLLLFCVFAVAAWHQYYPVACYRHWYWGAFLCIPVLVHALEKGLEKCGSHPHFPFLADQRKRILATVLLLTLLFSFDVGFRAVKGTQKLTETHRTEKFEHATYTHLNGLYLTPTVREHYADLTDTLAALQQQFPEANVVNTTGNALYAVFGKNDYTAPDDSDAVFDELYEDWLTAYIADSRPIVIGPEAPEGYLLYHTPKGYAGDPYAQSHGMPANIYLPAELYAQLP